MRKPGIIPILCLALLPFGTGCGEGQIDLSNGSVTDCGDGAAVVGVYDGILENVCGCTEADGTQAFPGDTFSCTVPAGTSVFFEYRGEFIPHLIKSIGTPSFLSGPPANIGTNTDIDSHVVLFDSVGTYSFRDEYNHALSGSITVF